MAKHLKAVPAAKPAESSADKFTRLAVQRMTALKARARQVGNLAGPTYTFTAAQKEKIIGEVFAIAHEIKNKFESAGKDKARDDFSF